MEDEYSTFFRPEYYDYDCLNIVIAARVLKGQTTKALNNCPRSIIRLSLLTSANILL